MEDRGSFAHQLLICCIRRWTGGPYIHPGIHIALSLRSDSDQGPRAFMYVMADLDVPTDPVDAGSIGALPMGQSSLTWMDTQMDRGRQGSGVDVHGESIRVHFTNNGKRYAEILSASQT